MLKQVLEEVDRQRIVEVARNVADIVSITGDEKEIAEYLGSEFDKLGMQVEYQEVEEGRPNVIGTLKGNRRRRDTHVLRSYGSLRQPARDGR